MTNGKQTLRRDRKRSKLDKKAKAKALQPKERKKNLKQILQIQAKKNQRTALDRRVATWDGRTTLAVIFTTILISILVPYGAISVIVTILLLVHQLLIRLIFTGPKKRSAPFSDPRWEVIQADNDTTLWLRALSKRESRHDSFIHGWQSLAEKYTERMELLGERGLHTLAIDLRGHGMAPDTLEWTAGKAIMDVKCVLESINETGCK